LHYTENGRKGNGRASVWGWVYRGLPNLVFSSLGRSFGVLEARLAFSACPNCQGEFHFLKWSRRLIGINARKGSFGLQRWNPPICPPSFPLV
jgi:hypothetical protein